jgi:DNA processing protein
MDIRDAIAASLLAGPGQRRMAEILRARGVSRPAERAPAHQAAITLESLAYAAGGDIGVRGQAGALRAAAERLLSRGRTRGIAALALDDARYPLALAEIFDPPLVLWVGGQIDALGGPAVAVVGSRAASPYALEVAERLGADLAGRAVTVVSGLARGVDSAAHRGALAGGGRTVAVLGSGVDVIYPAEHDALAEAIRARGAIVSELGPGTPPRPFHFPRRNRLISGLSLAVVVVEASKDSGSLITAACALEQGREVMAVPGNVLSGRNRGSHALLKDGAKIVESADDILEEIQGIGAAGASADAGDRPVSDPVLAHMAAGDSYDLDGLAQASGVDRVTLLTRLLELELAGAVRRVDGGRFVRSRRTC